MKKRLISILTAAVLAFSSFSALVSAQYLEEPYTDDFSNATVSGANWRYANTIDPRTANSTLISSNGTTDRAQVDGGILKLTTPSSNVNNGVFKEFDEPIDGNVKISLKVQIPSGNSNIIYMQGTGAVSKSDTRAIMQYVAFWFTNGILKITTPHQNLKNGATLLFEDPDYSSDKWYDISVTLYGSEKKYGISVEGSEEHKAKMSVGGNRFGDNEPYLGFCRIGFFLYNGAKINIDDVKVERDIPLVLNSQSINNGVANVPVDTAIELNFNKVMSNVSAITLTYLDENSIKQTVLCDVSVDQVDGKKVIIKPKNDLLPLETYTLTIPASIAAKDGKTLGTAKTITFTTQLVENLEITDAAFDGEAFTATVNNASADPITATARLVTYKVVNGVKQYVSEIKETITVDESYPYSKTLTDLPDDYVVSLSLLDGTKPLCAEASFDKNGAVTEVSEVVSSAANAIDYENGTVSIAKKIGTLAYVHKAIEVKNESGAVIYFDQILTNENGSAKFEFVPYAKAAASNYTITINGTEMSNETSENLAVDYTKFHVEITKPVIKGTLSAGNKVKADYTLTSVIGEDEGETTYEWFIGATADGDFGDPVATTTVNEYEIKDTDEYKYIKVKVTPKTKLGLAIGEAKESEAVMIQTLPLASSVSISGTAKVGNTLTGKYTYSHKGGAKQVGSTFRWLTSDTENGEYKEVGNGISYALTSADAEKYIKFEVTPKCDVEPKAGIAVETKPVYVKKKTTESNDDSSDSGFSGYVGGLPDKVIPDVKDDVFADISGHWANENITRLFEKGIVKGDDDGNFNPDNKITRAEFTAMMVRMLGLAEQSYAGMFGDVKADNWYATAIQTAVSNSLVKGDGDAFRPNDSITRQEMAIIAMAAYELKLGELTADEIDCADVESISSWAIDAVSKAYASGIINGRGDNTFAPKANTTRAEAASVIIRLADKIEGV